MDSAADFNENALVECEQPQDGGFLCPQVECKAKRPRHVFPNLSKLKLVSQCITHSLGSILNGAASI